MNIALIAHDSKKELMVQFCIAYCGIMSRHNLCATGTTGRLVSEATGLTVKRFLSGSQGGDQQIASLIACNEIDLLLFFRDPLTSKSLEQNEMNLLRPVRRPQYPDGDQYRDGGSFNPWPRTGRPRLADYRQPGVLSAPYICMTAK